MRLIYSGTRIKTRKRNIAAPLDPAAFADAVVQIYLDNAGDLVSLSCMCIIKLACLHKSEFYVIHLSFLLCRKLLPRALSLQTLTSQDTATPFLRQVSLFHFLYLVLGSICLASFWSNGDYMFQLYELDIGIKFFYRYIHVIVAKKKKSKKSFP